jgi:hypothetical protein
VLRDLYIAFASDLTVESDGDRGRARGALVEG